MASKGMKIAEALKHLGVDKSSDANDVKQAYRDLAKIWHPDRFQNDERVGAKAEAQIKIINEAKTVALAYIEKYGHFRHVKDENAGAGMGFEPPKPPPRYRQEQARPRPRPQPEPEPEPPPKKEPPKPPPKRPKPPPRAKQQTEPEPDIFEESMSFGDFVPGSTAIFVAAILIVLVGFFFMLGSSLFDSPVDRYKQFTEKTNLETAAKVEALKRKEAEQTRAKAAEKREEPKTEAVVLDTFFTLGSDKEWVSTVQGPPVQIRGPEWRYGFSTVQFDGNKVISWTSSELNPLKVGIILDPKRFYSERYFGVGSRRDEVAAIQGAPDIIQPDKWTYGDAWIEFDGDTVVSWQNDASIRLAIRY
ncbi:MAG: J domain-containing protein [Candidatus Marinimicrobia bacterium]|nr:J domain-containing protein [Candidatus Neomarinimicrobiota bacterium]